MRDSVCSVFSDVGVGLCRRGWRMPDLQGISFFPAPAPMDPRYAHSPVAWQQFLP